MTENNIPTVKIEDVNLMLGSTFDDLQNRLSTYLGPNILVKGKLLNVQEQVNRSKYAYVYQLCLEDATGRIEIEILKKSIVDFKDGDYVEILGQTKFNIYNATITKRIKAFSIRPADDDKEIKQLRADLDSFDKLKKFPPRAVAFPDKNHFKIAVIYSSATIVKIENDFYKHLNECKSYCEFNEITTSFSDELALSQAIDKASGSDVVVLIRGGGSEEHFKIFNSDRVLNSLSNLDAYRVVGLGHNTDITLLDYIADHSAFTPLDAGIHLKEQIMRLLSRDQKSIETVSKLKQCQNEIRYKDSEIQKLKNENQRLPSEQDISKLRDEKAHLNAELNLIRNSRPKYDSKVIPIVTIIAAIIGAILGKFML